MKKRKISAQRLVSIKNTIALIEEMIATRKKFTHKEFKDLSRKHHVRDGILKYAVERGYCKKVGIRNAYYEFVPGWKPTPRYVAFILDDRADSLHKCYQIRKQKQLERKKVDSSTKPKEKSTNPKKQKKKEQSIYEYMTVEGFSVKREFPGASITDLETTVVELNSQLRELDKTCLDYLDIIDVLEEKIESLENQKEEAYSLLFKMQKFQIEKKVNQLKKAV